MKPFVPEPSDERTDADRSDVDAHAVTRCDRRDPGDDFFCLRYQLWYPSIDCAIRTRYQTSGGCANCDQGRFNLRRHASALVRLDRTLCRTFRD